MFLRQWFRLLDWMWGPTSVWTTYNRCLDCNVGHTINILRVAAFVPPTQRFVCWSCGCSDGERIRPWIGRAWHGKRFEWTGGEVPLSGTPPTPKKASPKTTKAGLVNEPFEN